MVGIEAEFHLLAPLDLPVKDISESQFTGSVLASHLQQQIIPFVPEHNQVLVSRKVKVE